MTAIIVDVRIVPDSIRESGVKAGRPRKVTLDEIVQAARKTGLDKLRMPALAADLGIASGTLYNYVGSRDELLRLAATPTVRQDFVDNKDDDWKEVVRRRAKESFSFWVSEPELIDQFMRGIVGPDIMLDGIESFVSALAQRGFNNSEVYTVLSAINTLCFGSMFRHHYSAERKEIENRKSSIRNALRNRMADELPNLRLMFDTDKGPHFDFDTLLAVTIEGLAVQLGRS